MVATNQQLQLSKIRNSLKQAQGGAYDWQLEGVESNTRDVEET